MNVTTHSFDAQPGTSLISALHLVAGTMWLIVGVASLVEASVSTSSGGWEVPYLASSVALVIAASTTLMLAVRSATPVPGTIVGRVVWVAAFGIAVLGLIVAIGLPWAFAGWAPLSGLGFLGLAAAGPLGSRWVGALGAVLLVGVGLAVVGVVAEVGAPGSEGDHSEVQLWAQALTAIGMAAVLVWHRIGGARARGRVAAS